MDTKERTAKAHEVRGDQLLPSFPSQALKEYTTAIELFLGIASDKSAPAPQRTRCRSACEALMAKAEKLKREISENEKLTRRRSSLRSSVYKKRSSRGNDPVEKFQDKWRQVSSSEKWDESCYSTDNGSVHRDPYGFLKLSKSQEKLLLEWQRPHEFLEYPQLFDEGEGGMYLVQDIITDCSLVASLCAAAAWEVTHQEKLVTKNVFPLDDNSGSPSGKYIILLHVNGCVRQVVIDDLLPQSHDKPLHVTSKTTPDLIYPALIEKAFLKVMGGYDFPGSNSAIDLKVLTGWIPEVVQLQGNDTDLEGVWSRMIRGWRDGDVLVTVGTGDLTPSQETEFGLVGNHNYSVFDVIDRNGQRLLKIRNPWSRGGIPKSSFDFSSFWEDLDSDSMEEYTPGDPSLGTFWLDYTTLCQNFKTLYLNWNSAIFPYRSQKHFSFTPNGSDYDVGTNGQYTISVEGTCDVWILVERHYLGKTEGWSGYLGLAVFPSNERVYSYTRPSYRTEYVDVNYCLLKITGLPAKHPYTVLVIANDKTSVPPHPPRFFTLSIYATFPITISDPIDVLPHQVRVQGLWRKGISYNSRSSTFVENPQWKLVVPESKDRSTAKIVALLETKNPETAVNVTIAWSGGKRLARLANQDILCQSGEYAPQHARTASPRVKLSTQYTIIASRFEELSPPEEPFTLIIRSDVPVTLAPLREERAGKLRRTVTSSWESGETTKRFILSTLRLTAFSVRLSVLKSRRPPFVRLSLREGIDEEAEEEEGAELKSSGTQYSDLSLGEPCAIEEFDLVGGEEYILYVERLGDEDDEDVEFLLDFLADGELEPIEI